VPSAATDEALALPRRSKSIRGHGATATVSVVTRHVRHGAVARLASMADMRRKAAFHHYRRGKVRRSDCGSQAR